MKSGRANTEDLLLAKWAVLAAVAERQTHGYEIASRFRPDGSFGRIWTIPRPLVYRAISDLLGGGLLRELGSMPSADGPPRRLIEVTEFGRTALAEWLSRPVIHVRDARSELLLKLMFHDRQKNDPRPLLRSQQALLVPMLEGLRRQLDDVSGFDTTLVRWRLYSVEALARLVHELLVTAPDHRSPSLKTQTTRNPGT